MKGLVQKVFLVLIAPVFMLWKALSLLGFKQSFATFSQFLSLIPGQFGTYLRAAFYRLALPGTSQNVHVGFLSTLAGQSAEIGDYVYISSYVNIGNNIKIENDVIISAHCCVTSGRRQHNFADPDTPIRLQGGTFERVTIGRDSFIGAASVIMANIGEGAVVAAGSVVTEAVQAYSIVAGNPAKIVGSRKALNTGQKL